MSCDRIRKFRKGFCTSLRRLCPTENPMQAAFSTELCGCEMRRFQGAGCSKIVEKTGGQASVGRPGELTAPGDHGSFAATTAVMRGSCTNHAEVKAG
jgi:hypothetical protein